MLGCRLGQATLSFPGSIVARGGGEVNHPRSDIRTYLDATYSDGPPAVPTELFALLGRAFLRSPAGLQPIIRGAVAFVSKCRQETLALLAGLQYNVYAFAPASPGRSLGNSRNRAGTCPPITSAFATQPTEVES